MIKLEELMKSVEYHDYHSKNYRKREITKEQYDRAVNDHDASGIFTDSEVMGYGVYKTEYIEEDGRYFVTYELGDTCD